MSLVPGIKISENANAFYLLEQHSVSQEFKRKLKILNKYQDRLWYGFNPNWNSMESLLESLTLLPCMLDYPYDNKPHTYLSLAVMRREMDIIHCLVKCYGITVNMHLAYRVDSNFSFIYEPCCYALIVAVKRGYLEIVDFLLAHGAESCSRDPENIEVIALDLAINSPVEGMLDIFLVHYTKQKTCKHFNRDLKRIFLGMLRLRRIHECIKILGMFPHLVVHRSEGSDFEVRPLICDVVIIANYINISVTEVGMIFFAMAHHGVDFQLVYSRKSLYQKYRDDILDVITKTRNIYSRYSYLLLLEAYSSTDEIQMPSHVKQYLMDTNIVKDICSYLD